MAKWKLHELKTIKDLIFKYKCGLCAGDFVSLRKDLVIRDVRGRPTGDVRNAGEIWRVIPGIKSDPVLWLLEPDGDRHTWDDTVKSVQEWFVRVKEPGVFMSPTVLRQGPFRFYFFSREEPRMHVHVQNPHGEAKFWLEPQIELAQNYGFSNRDIKTALKLVKDHQNEIRAAWKKHFGR